MVNSQNQSMPEAEFTGRYLVLFREGAIAEGIQMLSEMTNMSFSSTEQTQADSPIVLDNLGIAIVNVNPEQINSLQVATEGHSPILAIEPERVVYAISANIVDNLIPVEQTTANASFDESSITWGLQATNVIGAFPSGQGIRIAVLDTGLDFNHPDFQGRVIYSNSFVQGQGVQDGHGHGTHCIGTACGPQKPEILPRYGIAYNCEIYVGKVLSNQGSGGDAGILQGIDWAVANGCQVISMSLGAPLRVGDRFSVVYEAAAQRALNQGTLIVAAAGNNGPQSPVNHPANCPSIMAIAAVNSQLQVADFSSRGINPNGGEINIAAPGVDVYSTFRMPERYATWNGTSMATPHVAGIAALYAETTGLRGKALWNLLLQTVRRLPLPSKDVGAGLVTWRNLSWALMGNELISGVGVSSWKPEVMDLFVRGTDNLLYYKWYDSNNGGWMQGYEQLGGGEISFSPVAVSGGGSDLVDVFARGIGASDGVYHKVWQGNVWSDWQRLGSMNTLSGPGLSREPGRHLDVFVRGTDNALYAYQYNPNDGWVGPWPLDGQISSSPTAIALVNGPVHVFARGTDNALWHRWYDGGWQNWESLGGPLGGQISPDPESGPSVASWGSGRLDVFVRGTDDAVWRKWSANGGASWSNWESLGGVVTSSPASISRAPNLIEVFVRGTDSKLYHKWWDGTAWRP
ncbi:S8 family serine peptidase [Tolypothrix sp. VBCCA 56010]|uniref:S8 family serine peptidase n=1 Tax=Tolypothrix sp. VBCCA 56010 TaxID=3137731 RepID=UPI003D7C8A83